MERDNCATRPPCLRCEISTHALTWSATRLSSVTQFTILFQLTRSRGARRVLFSRSGAEEKFQLTRSRGARRRNSNATIFSTNFNSRAHVERDLADPMSKPLSSAISTHALTWSATRLSSVTQFTILFQLTRSRGARRVLFSRSGAEEKFQLTRSRGARRRNSNATIFSTNFNSRAHVERDLADPMSKPLSSAISTHALTWSATRHLPLSTTRLIFQLTRSRGARRRGRCCQRHV